MQVVVPPLLQSKKFGAAALASILAFLGMHYGLTERQIAVIVSPLLLFIPSQGVADIGKEREKIARESAAIGNVTIVNRENPT